MVETKTQGKKTLSIEKIISELQLVEQAKLQFENQGKLLREQLLNEMLKNKQATYKDNKGIATISVVSKVSVKYDKDEMLEYLKKDNVVNYFEVIPEHAEIKKNLDKDIKTGAFNPPVKIEKSEKQNIAIRFNKN